MNMLDNKDEITFINPYDTKGGASLGTFRLFSYFRKFKSARMRLRVVVKASSEDSSVVGLPFFFRLLFYSQVIFNKLICMLFSKGQPPVAFSFFVPLSLPALLIYLSSLRSNNLYLHSMGSGFACPFSFFAFVKRASVIKTADDWYLTGGCHYSLSCNQWRSGCRSCPHMNFFGKLLVRLNWLYKHTILASSPNFVFVSPSHWLSSRFKYFYPLKSQVIYNSASKAAFKSSGFKSKELVEGSRFFSLNQAFTSPPTDALSLGLPVTYLRDKRKGFLEAMPELIEVLAHKPVNLILCGNDSHKYFDLVCSELSTLNPLSSVQSLGSLSPEGMYLFYSKVDFILHFARYDNSPNVVTESLSSGVPVIVLNHAGSPEHVRSSSAGFVLDDISHLHSCVELICGGSVNINNLKSRALEYAESVLSPKSMVESYSRVFSQNPIVGHLD